MEPDERPQAGGAGRCVPQPRRKAARRPEVQRRVPTADCEGQSRALPRRFTVHSPGQCTRCHPAGPGRPDHEHHRRAGHACLTSERRAGRHQPRPQAPADAGPQHWCRRRRAVRRVGSNPRAGQAARAVQRYRRGELRRAALLTEPAEVGPVQAVRQQLDRWPIVHAVRWHRGPRPACDRRPAAHPGRGRGSRSQPQRRSRPRRAGPGEPPQPRLPAPRTQRRTAAPPRPGAGTAHHRRSALQHGRRYLTDGPHGGTWHHLAAGASRPSGAPAPAASSNASAATPQAPPPAQAPCRRPQAPPAAS
jgi:hypothetical protein